MSKRFVCGLALLSVPLGLLAGGVVYAAHRAFGPRGVATGLGIIALSCALTWMIGKGIEMTSEY